MGAGDKELGKKLHRAAVKNVQEDIRTHARKKFAEFAIDPSWAEKLENTELKETDIHRHVIDGLAVKCPKCGKPMKRTLEVLDCWFESG